MSARLSTGDILHVTSLPASPGLGLRAIEGEDILP